MPDRAAVELAVELAVDPAYRHRSLAIEAGEDDAAVEQMELSTGLKLVESEIPNRKRNRVRILVLYGSLRSRSYSRLMAYEAARILFRLGCDARVYDSTGLPQKDDVQNSHPKVQELRELSK
ncbi:hypothetical protein TOPH_02845 [Tolypocladium ophioglossoides CBS 100239]|uniref:NADPH-dependent FMN reductase-like domain-containing protein n=1 Tax=Tolypocladium ophioglossoides (strain CBS 100239) TaxID=1163406 RepID=A0A0L0NEU4_TOLOC|nr:hypothetical protein TOPH_02845 [Tolypocladium ophioglossoides CBS 100239]